MTALSVAFQADELSDTDAGEASGAAFDGEATVRISNEDAENGYDQEPGPLTWLNSARVTTVPEEDAIHCVVSVGDPRGGFCFTVRRLPDGNIVIHVPHPSEPMPHLQTESLHDGTLVVVSAPGKPADFSDELILQFDHSGGQTARATARHEELTFFIDQDGATWKTSASSEDGNAWEGPECKSLREAMEACDRVARNDSDPDFSAEWDDSTEVPTVAS